MILEYARIFQNTHVTVHVHVSTLTAVHAVIFWCRSPFVVQCMNGWQQAHATPPLQPTVTALRLIPSVNYTGLYAYTSNARHATTDLYQRHCISSSCTI